MAQQGFSLIEVLISMVLLFLLLLGLDSVQLTSLQKAKSTYYFHTASQQLHVMSERLSIFKNKKLNEQIKEWNDQNRLVLPQGVGTVMGTHPHYELAIFWGENASQICKQNKMGQSGCLHRAVFLLTNKDSV